MTTVMRRKLLAPLLGVALAASLVTDDAAAGTLTVIGDTNSGSQANWPLFDNLLGDNKTLLFAPTIGQLGGLDIHFNSFPGVTSAVAAGPLTETALVGVDLLILTAFYNTGPIYSPSEAAAISSFVNGTGDVLFMAEASNPALLQAYNALLTAVGTSIRYTGQRIPGGAVVTDLPDAWPANGVDSFTLNYYNTLKGGKPIVSADGNVALAIDFLGVTAPVPVPAAHWALGGAIILLGGLRRLGGARRRS